MTRPVPSDVAALIVANLRGYAVVPLQPDGTITHWLGDAEALTGFGADEAIGRPLRMLFTEADQAAGAAELELATALETGRAEDSRWHRRKDGALFWANGLTVLTRSEPSMLVKVFRDETAAKKADEQRVLLLNELNHRVKNTLATVQSVTEHTLRSAGIDRTIRETLVERLMALARAHDVLTAESWAGADLHTLLGDLIGGYDRDPPPFAFDGPPVRLHPSQAVTLSMALHELATNASKYGALSVFEGRVEITWSLAHNGDGQRFLTLLWKERGGPPVAAPERAGFGSQLIRQSFANRPGSRVELTFPPEGARCVMVLSLAEETADPALQPEASLER